MTIIRQVTKAVVCLTPEQVEQLAQLDGLPTTAVFFVLIHDAVGSYIDRSLMHLRHSSEHNR